MQIERLGVLLNANARCVRHDPLLEKRLREIAEVERTESPDGVVPAAIALLERGADALALVGGDGTWTGTLTPLLRHFDAADLPPLVPTRGGTVNTIAASLGARGLPDATLSALRRGERMRSERRAVVRVVADDGPPVFGFLFINGVGVRFLELYYHESRMGAAGAFQVVGRICASALTGGALARRVFAPFEGDLSVDGELLKQRHFSIIAAGGVRHIGLGFAPFATAGGDPERIHLAATGASAARLALELPGLRLGARGRCIEHRPCRHAELVLGEPTGWSLDADRFPPARRLEIGAGPALRFLVP